MSKLLVIIGGPTASGKTGLAIEVAKYFHTVIISADSRQFYKELTIGTAKPSSEELNEVEHFFINSHSVTSHVSAGMFAEQANSLLSQLFNKHDVVVMAGGSGLYIDALINGIDVLPAADEKIREELKHVYQTEGINKLRQMLMEKDPESYNKIDTSNHRRISRALEVTLSTGKPYSSFLGKKNNSFAWNWMMAGIEWPREELYARINERTESMVHKGLKSEAEDVIKFRESNALRTVGYSEMFNHIDGKINIEETTALIAKNTRNYAKRQLTWFRKYPEMIWIKPGDSMQLILQIEKRISE